MNDDIFSLIAQEETRQRDTLMLIPSENYTSKAVREAVGSVLMNKYAEGRAGKRYYQGNSIMDEVERLCETRALEAFQLNESEWGVCVQAHSGGVANFAVLAALAPIPNGRVMSMYLPDGGHLSHGWQMKNRKISVASKIWNFEYYRIDERTRVFDYDVIESQAKIFKPHIMISGGTAYPREIDHERMAAIAHSMDAYYLADIAHEAGLVIGGANSSPFPYADVVTMTTHKTLRGPRGALVFGRKADDIFSRVDFSIFPGLQGGPHMHSIGGIAVALGESLTPKFSHYTKQIVTNAKILAKLLAEAGFDIVSGGTDKHLILIDLRDKELSGWVLAAALEVAGIITNRNTVPAETASPFYPSGLRLGTPAVTTRGMKEAQMEKIASWIAQVANHVHEEKLPEDKKLRQVFVKDFAEKIKQDQFLFGIATDVQKLCQEFPL
jgi:glycine hydroxymethyltransferase